MYSNPHAGGDHMTQPAEFEQRVTETLQYLDTSLPAGSYVFLIGLEDGLIWDVMHDQPHPLNVTYEQLWDFVSCLGINPCWGWLNPDPYWRNYTTYMADQLNAVFPRIVTSHTYKNFDMVYLGDF
eukprot:EC714546.1.p1 GENE.EC714546.1~~EC714546.1.p1  ORF type:complete len:125 (+),score=25.57 EC714546.1:172-546(+)